MLLNKIVLSTVVSVAFTTYLSAFNPFQQNLDQEIEANKALIQKYESSIKKLQERNKTLLEKKAANPKLYETKPLYEENSNAYIHRVKLDGAEAKNVSFTIKNHVLSIEMNIKVEQKSENNYFASSRYFFQSYPIPKDVDESKIKNSVDGDYFVIEMPKNNVLKK